MSVSLHQLSRWIPKTSHPLTLQLGLHHNQPLSTLPRPTFSLNPITRKPNTSALQPSASGDNQTPRLGHPPQGSADKALSQEAMAAEIAQLRQQLQFTKETLKDVRDQHGSEIRLYQGELESLKEDKSQIERVVHELEVE